MSFIQSRFRRENDSREHTYPSQVEEFLSEVQSQCGAEVHVDAPDDHNGEWWFDICYNGHEATISWRPEFGFGFYTADLGFGDYPDEVFRAPAVAALRACFLIDQLSSGATDMLMWLSQVRKLSGKPQMELADILKINQAAVSRIENREDVKLSTLASYIQAMGGTLEMRVKLDGFYAVVSPHKHKVTS